MQSKRRISAEEQIWFTLSCALVEMKNGIWKSKLMTWEEREGGPLTTAWGCGGKGCLVKPKRGQVWLERDWGAQPIQNLGFQETLKRIYFQVQVKVCISYDTLRSRDGVRSPPLTLIIFLSWMLPSFHVAAAFKSFSKPPSRLPLALDTADVALRSAERRRRACAACGASSESRYLLPKLLNRLKIMHRLLLYGNRTIIHRGLSDDLQS